MKKYKVTLTADERQSLHDLVTAGKAAAKKLAHARILLKADAAPGGPAWTDDRIADAVEVSTDTVARVRQRFVEDSLDAALARKKPARPSRRSSTGGPRPGSSPSPAPRPRTSAPGGPCGCWPTSWSSWRSCPPSRPRRSGG